MSQGNTPDHYQRTGELRSGQSLIHINGRNGRLPAT
jgi:hypothetical protein